MPAAVADLFGGRQRSRKGETLDPAPGKHTVSRQLVWRHLALQAAELEPTRECLAPCAGITLAGLEVCIWRGAGQTKQ